MTRSHDVPSPSPVTLCGSLSLHPVSLGMNMHRAGYEALGLPFAYVPFAMTSAGLADALRAMRILGIRGFGVSMPFKIEILPLLDAIDPQAARIGAVNTVVNDEGRLTGYNTDATGAARAIEEVTALAGRRAVVVGAGGAARAVAHALLDGGAAVHLANRTAERARELAEELRQVSATRGDGGALSSGALEDLVSLQGHDLLVNASSAGMPEYGAASPVPPSLLHSGLVVMDIVYRPMRTALIEAAEAAGAVAIHGGRMLLHQACRQFELYTRRAAPLEAMDRALRLGLDP